jgi:hypothetical protein
MASMIGCGGTDGPERAVVHGKVTYMGQPIEKGDIRFVPTAGTKAPVSGAKIENGEYRADIKGGVPVGTHQVQISAFRPDPRFREMIENLPPDATELERPPDEQYLPAKYNRQSELQITIDPGAGTVEKDFQLTQ